MNGILVALDTSTEAVAVGVARIDADGTTVLSGGYEVAPRQANAKVLPAIVDALAEAGVELQDVIGVIVGRGPGSFTGVRIGVAAAKGLAQGLGVPLAGIGTLDAVAWRLRRHDGAVAVIGDAMRGEVYPALFRVESGVVTRMSQDMVARPADVAQTWAQQLGEPIVLTGNGLAKHAQIFIDEMGESATLADEALWWPDGPGLFGAFDIAGGERLFGDPGAVLPIYTRLSDAEEAERVRRGLGAAPPPGNGVAGGPATESGGEA